jgi:SAM-dependent methyltransferase
MSQHKHKDYDPIEFWLRDQDFPRPNIEQVPAHIAHTKAIKTLLEPLKEEIKTVLEIGCGYGRITKFMLENYPEIECYHAIDLSSFKTGKAEEYIPLSKYPESLKVSTFDFNPSVLDDDRITDLALSKFDLVLCTEVLMHQLPSQIEAWIKKMNLLSRRYLLNIDWYESKPPDVIASHNFIHDYEALYRRLIVNCDVVQVKIDGLPQRIYVVLK